jgi:hypothetical protein
MAVPTKRDFQGRVIADPHHVVVFQERAGDEA